MKTDGGPQSQRRRYRMTSRADSTAETGKRILDAAMTGFSTMLFDEVTLARIAEDAGVTVQTVIRRYGSKEGLFAALGDREGARIRAERQPGGSPEPTMETAVQALVAHYESDGRAVLNFLRQEKRIPQITEMLASGRRVHEDWVVEHCKPILGSVQGAEHLRRLNAAIAATDIYTWKLLRLDRGLGRREVEETMLALLEGLNSTGGN